MRIICLAWGSLVWNPGVLALDGEWYAGGPMLPIEFARVGDKGELATVLTPGKTSSPARWVKLKAQELVVARRLLRQREGIAKDRVAGVGSVVRGQPPGRLLGASEILQWMSGRLDVDAAIWTSLPPRFAGVEGRIPSPTEAAGYVLSLKDDKRRHAEDYVCRVPAEIQTANRTALQKVIRS